MVNDLDGLCAVLLAVNAAALDILGSGDVGANRTGLFKVATLLLGAKSGSDGNAENNDSSSDAHDGAIGGGWFALCRLDNGGFSDGVDDLGGRRGNHVSELVGDADKGRAECRG